MASEEIKKETMYLVKLLTDMGFDAYDDGDGSISGSYPSWAYEMASSLIDSGWVKKS